MSYYNPFKEPITVELRLSLLAVGPRQLTLTHGGRPVGMVEVDRTKQVLRVPDLILPPGVNRFRLESDEPPQRQGSGRYRLRSFGLLRAWLRIHSAPYLPENGPE